MTQHRTSLFWALWAAILALLLCSVGLADESAESTNDFLLYNVPENVALHIDSASPGVLYRDVFIFEARFDKHDTTISKLDITLTPKDEANDIINVLRIDTSLNGDKCICEVAVRYEPVYVGTGEYTLTVIANGDDSYKATQDITFTVADKNPGSPISIDVNTEYFDKNNVYSKELVLEGKSVTLNSVYTIFPTYTINGETKLCTILTKEDSGFMYRDNSFIFSKPGTFTIKFSTSTSGNSWEPIVALIFVVADGSKPSEPEEAPTAPPVITGIPDEDTLVPIVWQNAPKFTLTVDDAPWDVIWELSCDNAKIELDHSELSGNELNIWVRGNTYSVTGTVTVKAWYEGYDDKVAIITFNVHTKAHNTEALILDEVPDAVILSMETRFEDYLTVHENPEMWLFVLYDDYSSVTDLEQPTFTFKSGSDVLKNIRVESCFDDDNDRWRIIIRYDAATTGTGVYSLYACVPHGGPSISKDITFTVVDRIDDPPTKFNISPDYFDENNVYKTVLKMPEDGSKLVFNFSNEAHPTYTMGDKVYNAGFDVISPIDWHNGLVFKKAGRYPLGLIAAPNGSNWQLMDIVYIIVHSDIPPKNLTPTLTGVPEGDVLLSDDATNITITATNLEQMVNWEVTCDNDEIGINHESNASDDESNLDMYLWGNSAGISGTVTIKAWYEGYEDHAAIKKFNVCVANNLMLGSIPESVTLYKSEASGDSAVVSDIANMEFDCYFTDGTYPESIEVTFTRKGEQDNLITGSEFDNGYGIIKYATSSISAGVYELTASTPDGQYTVSCDIEFIIDNVPAELPSYFEFDPEYFDADKAYCHDELVMPADGSPLELTFLWENFPKYTLNGEKKSCSIDVNGTGIAFGENGTWIFPAAGTYEVKCFADSNGSNWELVDKAYFVVKPYVDPDPVDPWPPYTPVEDPTAEPTLEPTAEPTAEPTLAPTAEPTAAPTPTPVPIKEVTTGGKNLKVRLNPGTGAVVAKLPDGTRLEVLGTENGWSRIRATMPDGSVVEGFVMDDYLSDVEPTAAPATPTPAATATAQPGAAPTPTPAPIKEVTTGGKNLKVRLNPGTGAVVAKLPDGTRLEVLGTENGWSRIRATMPDGSVVEGFVMDDYLSDVEPTAAPATPTPAATATAQPGAATTPAPLPSGEPTPAPAESAAKVNTSGSALRLRSDPSTSSDVLVRMPNGADVTILETVDGWTRIRFVAKNGKEYEGWASSDFIKADERPAPTATPAPTAVPAPTATPAPNSGARVDAGGKKLKLRRQPGSSGSGVTTKIPDGAELIVLEYGEEWSLCSYNGVTGYCATAYLKFN